MRNWLVAAVLGATLGCQAGAPGSTDRELTARSQASVDDCYGEANFCNTPLPQPRSWSAGDPLPKVPDSTVVLMTRATKSVWRAYAADAKNRTVHWVMTLKPDAVGALTTAVTDLDLAALIVRPPPPPDCPPTCIEPGDYWLALALRTQDVELQALSDIAACPLK